MKKLLCIVSHPADWVVIAGGTIEKYKKNGWKIHFVSATRTCAGEPEVSGEELFGPVTYLDLEEGQVSAEHPGVIEAKLIPILQTLTPDVVITHDPAGTTNHPDHMKMSVAATYAFQVYASTHDTAKLYYACIPKTVMTFFQKKKIFPEESSGKKITGVEDKRITTVITIPSANPLLSKEYFILRMVGLTEVFMGKYDRVSNRL